MRRTRWTLLGAIAALLAANLVIAACGTDTITQVPPNQQFPTSPVALAQPVVFGFFTDTSATADAVMDDLALLGAHVVVIPVGDDAGIAAARHASSDGIAGYLALVLPGPPDAGLTTPDGGVPAISCDALVATTTAQFDSLIDAAPDLQRFYLPASLGVTFDDCTADAAATIAQHIRKAGPSALSIAIAPALDETTAPCDDVCVDGLSAAWTSYLQTAQIDVVMLNDGVLGKGVDPAVARSYFAPFASACANANATFYVSAESYVGTNRASAPAFYGRLDFYADAGLDAQVITRTVEVDAAWACTTDGAPCDDLALCQATRLAGSACP